MIAITVENLVKKFGKTTALNGVGFRVEPGELFFLLGPSGCGKTTLLRGVAGFIGETNFLPGRIQSAAGRSAVVETVVGKFEGFVCDPNWLPKPGEEATLSIRPECWTLRKEPVPVNCAKGRIGEAIYLGEVAQYRLATGEHSLKIFELNPHPSDRPPDSDFFAVVHSDDVAVLRK